MGRMNIAKKANATKIARQSKCFASLRVHNLLDNPNHIDPPPIFKSFIFTDGFAKKQYDIPADIAPFGTKSYFIPQHADPTP
jgi:hypothetical protein